MRSIGMGCVLMVTISACAIDDQLGQSGSSETVVLGDTTIVHSSGSGLWGGEAQLVQGVTIGVLEGAEEYQFGFVSHIAVDASGGIYVFDGQVPALRYYDASGTYVRTLGAEGEGPGEYKDAALGLSVRRRDGRVVMRDPRNMRLNVYGADGSPSESWRVESGLFTSQSTTLDTFDHMYLKIMTGRPEPNQAWPIAILHMDDQGQIVDTLIPPTLPNEPTDGGGTFTVSKEWTVSSEGGFVVGVNDRYAIDHYRPDGTVLRISRDAEPALVLPDERKELEDRNAWLRKTQGQFMTSEIPPVPSTKPIYRGLAVGQEGRLWVRRYVEAEKGEVRQASARPGQEPPPPTSWREPIVYDVFEADGSFLGSLRLPARTSLSVFRGDRVWGVRRGELDETYVVGFTIAHD